MMKKSYKMKINFNIFELLRVVWKEIWHFLSSVEHGNAHNRHRKQNTGENDQRITSTINPLSPTNIKETIASTILSTKNKTNDLI